MINKTIRKRVNKDCVVCEKAMSVILYDDKSYRGGHYFGKTPIASKKEWAKARKAGTHIYNLCGLEIQVMNKDPKPYKFSEYWECPACYWGGK